MGEDDRAPIAPIVNPTQKPSQIRLTQISEVLVILRKSCYVKPGFARQFIALNCQHQTVAGRRAPQTPSYAEREDDG